MTALVALCLALLAAPASASDTADRATMLLIAKGYTVTSAKLDTVYRQPPCRTESVSVVAITPDKKHRIEARVCCNATTCVGPYNNASYRLEPVP